MNKKRWDLAEVVIKMGICNWNWARESKTIGSFHYGELMQLFRKYNWYTYRPIHIELEYESYGPLYSFDISVLGFGICVSVKPPWQTKESLELQQSIEETKNYPEKLIPWETIEKEWAVEKLINKLGKHLEKNAMLGHQKKATKDAYRHLAQVAFEWLRQKGEKHEN